ncbi:HPr kinase/phosphorylase [Frankliniella fusca]|uniref:HPr kinase/phosphorylase n=1 Tax=Frankliniella fusca TaxID=407009 RepID=A0AAE1LKT1_9NEOP|nr:HPr kinase/phosphorylase [Frankliniella fusca]
MLPLYILALKMMALKSILLGKMTLMLVAFNILRNVQQRQMEDDHNSRVAAEYYGYHDDGIEYGGWVNRRRAFSGRSATSGVRQQRNQRSSRRRR